MGAERFNAGPRYDSLPGFARAAAITSSIERKEIRKELRR
jgi:hypothetical protein